METIDVEVTDRTLAFMAEAKKEDKPFFIWYNTTRMHINTHLKPESQGKTGYGVYADGMVEHDFMVGQILDKLKELGLEENTIVMYSTDNGNEFYGWPDGGSSFFRGEKNTQWEGGYRVPCVIRWPGVIKPGTLINDFAAHEDMIPTLLAAAGQPNVKQELLNGKSIGGKNYKVHLDGYNLLPALKDGSEWPRKEFIYWTDGGDVAALRYKDWKVTYLRQDAVGMNVWVMPFTELRAPMITNLKMDPFERAFDESTGYNHWLNERMYILTPATSFVAGWMESFKEFPPRMKPGSFSLDRVMEAATSGKK
jgi:arylsulfatase